MESHEIAVALKKIADELHRLAQIVSGGPVVTPNSGGGPGEEDPGH